MAEQNKKRVVRNALLPDSGSRDLITILVGVGVTALAIGLVLLPFEMGPEWHCMMDGTCGLSEAEMGHVEYPANYGFTIFLILYFAPATVGLIWACVDPKFRMIRRPLLITLAILWAFSVVADLGILGATFFTFPPHAEGAVLGWMLPAWDWAELKPEWIPAEDLLFYIGAVQLTLVMYVWATMTFLKTTTEDYIPDWTGEKVADVLRNGEVVECWHRTEVSEERFSPDKKGQIWRIVWRKLKEEKQYPIGALVVLGLAIGSAYIIRAIVGHDGHPIYLIWLTVGVTVPSMLLLAFTKDHTNWRAFAFTALFMLLISGLFEVTIALPYEWWGFNDDLLIGWRVEAWWDIPIEQLILYVVNTWEIVLLYEAVTLFLAWRRDRELPPAGAVPPAVLQELDRQILAESRGGVSRW